jgi:hypothetical protein
MLVFKPCKFKIFRTQLQKNKLSLIDDLKSGFIDSLTFKRRKVCLYCKLDNINEWDKCKNCYYQ